MDANQFDHVARNLTSSAPRRTALGLLLGGALGLADLTQSEAKKGKKKRKKNKNKNQTPPPVPPPTGPTCSDGVRNGTETDIDCGGPTCPRCGNGRTCARNTDCSTSRCGNGRGQGGVCKACSSEDMCGSDASGDCRCNEGTGVCLSNVEPQLVATCNLCPQGTACIDFFEGPGCMPLCGG